MPRRHGPVPGQPGNFSRKCCWLLPLAFVCAAGVARESEPAAPSILRHVFVRRLARLESLDRRVRSSMLAAAAVLRTGAALLMALFQSTAEQHLMALFRESKQRRQVAHLYLFFEVPNMIKRVLTGT